MPGQTRSSPTVDTAITGAFNGGPGNCPAKPTLASVPIPRTSSRPSMEGRAIARPNPEDQRRHPGGGTKLPSMEGRAIARPNATRAAIGTHAVGIHVPSMEGRAIARPNRRRVRCDQRRIISPSMEGRAIARPNRGVSNPSPGRWRPLQWRAGQLPGQTARLSPAVAPGRRTFNGGPGNCPAKLARIGDVDD